MLEHIRNFLLSLFSEKKTATRTEKPLKTLSSHELRPFSEAFQENNYEEKFFNVPQSLDKQGENFSAGIAEKKTSLPLVLVDDVLFQAEEQKKEVEDMGEELLIERDRFEQLKNEIEALRKEREQLKLELLAIQNSNNNPKLRSQPINNELNLGEHSALLRPSTFLSASYNKSLFQHSIAARGEATISDAEEINREINESLNIIEESVFQLEREQEAVLSQLMNMKNQ